ncbi:MAG: YdeI/OmpD-associated family protein [Saprospiraceae bacterium]
MEARFKTTIQKFDYSLWSFHVVIPEDIYKEFAKLKIKRVMAQFDSHNPIHAGIMPAGNGIYFIKLNKELMKEYNLELNSNVSVSLKKDDSKYGMPISEEMEELLLQDDIGATYFEALTGGKARSLLHIVNKFKSSDKRIEKSIIILNHLKANRGSIDFKMLNLAFKDGRINF